MTKDHLEVDEAVSVFREASRAIREKREEIRRLDAACGDGDLGITVDKGFKAVEGVLEDFNPEEDELGKTLKKAGMEFNSRAASTFGVFVATACMQAGDAIGDKVALTLADIVSMLEAAAEGISDRGGAEVGDKTILDALVPAVEATKGALQKGMTVKEALRKAAGAAESGARGTKGMKPRTGRAKQLGDRAIDVQDPGATVVHYFLDEIANQLN